MREIMDREVMDEETMDEDTISTDNSRWITPIYGYFIFNIPTHCTLIYGLTIIDSSIHCLHHPLFPSSIVYIIHGIPINKLLIHNHPIHDASVDISWHGWNIAWVSISWVDNPWMDDNYMLFCYVFCACITVVIPHWITFSIFHMCRKVGVHFITFCSPKDNDFEHFRSLGIHPRSIPTIQSH